MAGERFNRESGRPMLAEAAPAGESPDVEFETADVLTRLERQAAESGRLEGRVQILERALTTERDARRRLADRLQRERKAASAIHERAASDQAAHASTAEELERLREWATASEQQMHLLRTQLVQTEQQLAWKSRPLWRKLLRRSPAA